MKKILVIEDSKAVARLLASQIEIQTNLSCDIAHTKQRAFELITENPDGYAVATVDLNLPDASGIDIVASMAGFELPTVVLTGTINQTLREQILGYEFVADYVIKSVPGAIEYVADYVKRLVSNQGVKVLIVDDSRTALQLMTAIASSQKLEVVTASSANQALIKMEQHPDISLVVTDGELGEISGIDLIHDIRKQHSATELPIIGVSGAYSRETSVRFLKAGANDFITKPILEEEFIVRLNQLLAHQDTINELVTMGEHQSTLLKIASHDIKDPLANIQSLSGFLLESGNSGSSDNQHGLSLINQTTANLVALVGKLGDFSRLSLADIKLCPDIIEASELISELTPMYKSQAKDKQITLSFDVEHAELYVDRKLLKQAMANLISNAIVFSPKGSSVVVSAKAAYGDWLFSVTDQGPGILPDEQSRIFSPLAKITNKPTAGETCAGLGLALTQKLVELNNGSIQYRDVGQASKFSILIPTIEVPC